MSLEMGRSINLLSTMLLAMKVPAKRYKLDTSFSFSCVSDLTSNGAGNRVPSG